MTSKERSSIISKRHRMKSSSTSTIHSLSVTSHGLHTPTQTYPSLQSSRAESSTSRITSPSKDGGDLARRPSPPSAAPVSTRGVAQMRPPHSSSAAPLHFADRRRAETTRSDGGYSDRLPVGERKRVSWAVSGPKPYLQETVDNLPPNIIRVCCEDARSKELIRAA